MKRVFLLILMVVLSITLIACGGNKSVDNGQTSTGSTSNTESNSTVAASGNTDASPAQASSSIYKTAGSELGDFTNSLIESETIFENPINSSDTIPIDLQMDRVTPNLALLTAPQYDMLSFDNNDKEQGVLMISGYDGIREKAGNTIKFNGKYVFTEDGFGNNKKGDIHTEQGSLDTKTNTFIYESKDERDGKVLSHTVFEAVILPDGTYLIQYLTAVQSSSEPGVINHTAVFKRYNKNDYAAVIATFDKDVNFTYDSIAGKGDIKAEDMSKGYDVKGKIIVSGSNVSFEK